MGDQALAAILDWFSVLAGNHGIRASAVLLPIEGAEAEEAVDVFPVMTGIVRTISVFKIRSGHNNPSLKKRSPRYENCALDYSAASAGATTTLREGSSPTL